MSTSADLPTKFGGLHVSTSADLPTKLRGGLHVSTSADLPTGWGVYMCLQVPICR